MNKELLKKIIPAGIWRRLRKARILRDHKRIAELCDGYITDYFDGKTFRFPNEPKQNLSGKKIIWQYWAQGFDGDLPEVVRVCLESVDKYREDYEIIRLSDETIADYVDLPDYVWAKRGHGFSVTAFSNVLRLALLYHYGGVWIDATVLLTGPIPSKYEEYDFFMFQRDDSEQNKRYWEDSYAYYFGWEKDFKVRVLTSIAFSKPGSSFTGDYLNLLLLVWDRNDTYPFYFTFQVLFNQLVESGKVDKPCPIESDCTPHMMMQIMNDDNAPFDIFEVVRKWNIHKLSYKEMNISNFKKYYELLS